MSQHGSKFQVVVVGPNLPQQAKATFHVHAAGCADLKRGWIRRYVDLEGDTMVVGSRLDVEADVYDFCQREDPDYVLGSYQSEFHFAPCLDELPLAADAKPVVTSEQYELLKEIGTAADNLRTYAGHMRADAERIERNLADGFSSLGMSSSHADVVKATGVLDALVQVAARTFHDERFAVIVRAVVADGRGAVHELVEEAR